MLDGRPGGGAAGDAVASRPVGATGAPGDALDPAVRDELLRESGGNPFYLLQLARTRARDRGATAAGDLLGDEIPPAVAAALAAELALLPADALTLLRGAAVAGDPTDAAFAAAVAGLDAERLPEAVDALLAADLLRPAAAPGWLGFRHPLVRRAVHAATSAGWRSAAHGRAAELLREWGAGAPARAHHVEQAAVRGDREAVALLSAAAEEVAPRAPATAARWLEAALRLLPPGDAAAGADRAAGARWRRRSRRPAASTRRTPSCATCWRRPRPTRRRTCRRRPAAPRSSGCSAATPSPAPASSPPSPASTTPRPDEASPAPTRPRPTPPSPPRRRRPTTPSPTSRWRCASS